MSLTSTPRGSKEPNLRPVRRDRQQPRFPSLQIDDERHNLQPTRQQQYIMYGESEEPYFKPTQRPSLAIDDRQDNLQTGQPRVQYAMQSGTPSSGHQRQSQQGGHQTHKNHRKLGKLATWFAMACCALLWTVIILGGLVVLIVYLVFRPKSPLFDIQSATLNAAYLDTGTLLNADITILANFSNPNRKVHVAFSYVQVDLYFMRTAVATQAVGPFAERPGESALKNLHMIASEVPLPQEAAAEWRRGTLEEGVALEVAGRFRTRSDFGKWLHFTYWLYGRCTIEIGAPPSGVLLSSRCRTKR